MSGVEVSIFTLIWHGSNLSLVGNKRLADEKKECGVLMSWLWL